MKHEKSKRTGKDQLTSAVDDQAANEGLYETDSERASPASYERRSEMWAEFNRGDWLFVVAVYLILSSVAFVVI